MARKVGAITLQQMYATPWTGKLSHDAPRRKANWMVLGKTIRETGSALEMSAANPRVASDLAHSTCRCFASSSREERDKAVRCFDSEDVFRNAFPSTACPQLSSSNACPSTSHSERSAGPKTIACSAGVIVLGRPRVPAAPDASPVDPRGRREVAVPTCAMGESWSSICSLVP